jgi:hypothetical protein
MATMEIGIRIDLEKGLAYFGVDEVNQRIADGARVIEIRPGGAIMSKTDSDRDTVKMTLSGCQFQIVLDDS